MRVSGPAINRKLQYDRTEEAAAAAARPIAPYHMSRQQDITHGPIIYDDHALA